MQIVVGSEVGNVVDRLSLEITGFWCCWLSGQGCGFGILLVYRQNKSSLGQEMSRGGDCEAD